MPSLRALAALSFCLIPAGAASAYPEAQGDRVRHPVLRWALPLDGPLGSPFGYRWGRMHEGIDIEGWAETRVRAASPGVVTRVGWLDGYEGYGLVIKIRHEAGFVTMYAHLAKAFAKRGNRVFRRQLIGRAGCTGSCTGTHLHFQMWRKGKLVDPLRFLGRRAFIR